MGPSRLFLMNWRPWTNISRLMYSYLWLSEKYFIACKYLCTCENSDWIILWVGSGPIHCWGKDNCCWLELGTEALPSRDCSWPFQEVECPWKLDPCPQLHKGTRTLLCCWILSWFHALQMLGEFFLFFATISPSLQSIWRWNEVSQSPFPDMWYSTLIWLYSDYLKVKSAAVMFQSNSLFLEFFVPLMWNTGSFSSRNPRRDLAP